MEIASKAMTIQLKETKMTFKVTKMTLKEIPIKSKATAT